MEKKSERRVMAGCCGRPTAATWHRNFNGCFAAVNLKDWISGSCPERTDGISMGDGCYRVLNLPLTRISYLDLDKPELKPFQSLSRQFLVIAKDS